MTQDPAIRALFGPAPSNLDLTASDVSVNNGAVIAMFCLAAVLVILRFVARIVLRNALMADDWAIIAALVCIGGTTGLSVAGGTTGAGKHIWAAKLDELMALYRILYSYTFIYAASCTCTRLSILFFYKRIFSPLERPLQVALIFGGFLTLSYPIIVWVTMGNACKPVSYFWTQFSGTEGHCIDVQQFFLAAGILNMLNDFVVLVIPFPRIIQLQMSVKKKSAICGIMAVGIFVCVASIVRIHYLYEFAGTIDVTWLMGPLFIWSTIEPSVAIVCACLPHLAPLARLVRLSVSSTLYSQQSAGISSDRTRRPHNRPERGLHNSKMASARGTTFDFGLEQMKRKANDDEIGLTNYVTVDPNENMYHSNASISDDHGHDQSIAVHSSFVQSSSRPSF
ncbi:hypothetical protein N7535_007153 [Penicillium sp. DV-2018c]|nr:hypothetical protein N7461_006752 [Penicillium sp. DV-2018c]KAJ5567847.1 hypothetical protein N7535_007153 [Penicillium sp. DV-2018c]